MFTLFEWLVVPGLIQISAVSLFYFTIQFTAQYFPKNEKQKLAKSLRIGLAFISLSISLYSLAEILDTNNKFQLAGFLFLLVCLIVPWGMVVAILTYFRFGIVQKYYKKKM